MLLSPILLLAVQEPLVFSLPRANPLGLAVAARPSPYRLGIGSGVIRTTAKERAFAADGTYCSVVGARRCTKKPPTILHATFGEDED